MKLFYFLCSLAGVLLFASGGPNPARAESVPGLTELAPSVAEPAGALVLRDAVAAALVGNPELAVFSLEVRSRDARAIQAGLLPNPQLLVELENLGGSGDRAAFEQGETTVWLSQLVPIGGKLSRRRRVAELDRDVSQWQYEAVKLGVLTDTTKAFVAALAAQKQLDLLRELERLAGDSVRQFRSLADAGGASQVERTRAEVELSIVRVRRQYAEGALTASRAALAASWGSAVPQFSSIAGDLAELVAAPPLAELERLVRENPDVARWVTELDRRSAALSLAEARSLPDPTLSLGGRHFSDNGDSAVVFAVSVPLPVFDRNQGNVLAASRDLSKAKAQRASAELSVRVRVRQRYAELLAAYGQAETLRRDSIPAAEQMYVGTKVGYREGLFRSLDVIEAQRTLFELRSRHLNILATYHFARADLERLTGTAFKADRKPEVGP